MQKPCAKCKTPKDICAFYAHPRNKDGYDAYCKECRKRTTREDRRKRSSEELLEYDLDRLYGITVDDFHSMEERQQHVCAICHGPPVSKKRLGVDHDAKTGQVRGLLCDLCNRAIGMLAHDIGRLEAAIAYLKEFAP